MQGQWGRVGTDLNDSNSGAHAQEDAEVLLQPRLHLLHASLWKDCTSATMHSCRGPAQGSLSRHRPPHALADDV